MDVFCALNFVFCARCPTRVTDWGSNRNHHHQEGRTHEETEITISCSDNLSTTETPMSTTDYPMYTTMDTTTMDTTTAPTTTPSPADPCYENKVQVITTIKKIKKVKTVSECRDKCNDKMDCQFFQYRWHKKKKVRTCYLQKVAFIRMKKNWYSGTKNCIIPTAIRTSASFTNSATEDSDYDADYEEDYDEDDDYYEVGVPKHH